jgi:hypothetical protein
VRADDVKVGQHVQLGGDHTWTDEPRRAEVVAFEKRRRTDTMRQVRLRFLLPDGTVDPEPTGSEWWRPADVVGWEPWVHDYAKRQARRDHRSEVVGRLSKALEAAGLGDLVSVQSGQAVTGTVHMVIGDLVDTDVVADRLRRLAGQ